MRSAVAEAGEPSLWIRAEADQDLGLETRNETRFVLRARPTEVSPKPGRHVAQNAAGALALLAELGHDLKTLGPSLTGFKGVGRRWEHRGTVAGVMLYDDYAHHPTEVRATLEAARVRGKGSMVFQPQFTEDRRFSHEFGEALPRRTSWS
jgi:UDP-N-acetylmuramate-alanine ligase